VVVDAATEPHGTLPEAGRERLPGPGPFTVGQTVGGGFEIVGLLGVGGMNAVYEARDRALGRTVALKAPLLEAYADALRREARALAALRAPSFVTVHQLGREGDVEFIVMERLYGETLEQRIDDQRRAHRPMAVPEVARLLVALAEALATAHASGITHRDLKPGNVILAGDRVVLVDLGLVVPETLASRDDVIAGSAHYIAPEVLLHDVAKGGGPLVDLYALGVIAFELLTNVPPYVGDSVERVFSSHVGAPVPDVRALRPDVPELLAALVSELLAKDPRARPPGAEAVLWQLRDLQIHGIYSKREVKVLAIDDDVAVARAVKKSLESTFPSLKVETTSDPARALVGMASLPDVVLVDLHMPEENGVEVCMRVASIPARKRPIVVAMSAQATPSDIEVLKKVGVRHFVPKDEAFLAEMSNIIATLRAER